jgi:hypothetical protein
MQSVRVCVFSHLKVSNSEHTFTKIGMKLAIVQCVPRPTYFKFPKIVKNKIVNMWTYEVEAILSLVSGSINYEQRSNYNGRAFKPLQNVVTI